MMLRLLCAMTFALGPVLAQASSPTRGDEAVDAHQILWQRSLDDALALCKATGRPLLIAVNMDGESASDRIVHEEYRDAAFVASTRRCVCLGASLFRHNARDYDDQGRRIPCPRFGEITCGEHVALEPLLFAKYLSDGERVAPRHALVLPDGKKAFDLSLCFDLKDIDKALAAAVQGLAGDQPADGSASWAALAARRDCRGRAALEAAVADVRDDTVATALAAIGEHGDKGSLDALRILAARVQTLSLAGWEGMATPALSHDLAKDYFAAMQGLMQTLGGVPGDPGPTLRARALMRPLAMLRVLATAEQKSFLLACCAVGSCPAEYLDSALGLPLENGPDQGVRSREVMASLGGPVSLQALLQVAAMVARGEAQLPSAGGPTDAMAEAEALQQQLEQLDAERQDRRDDPEWYAQYAKASLDLGRRHIEGGQRDAQVLLEDAALHFQKALDKAPDHCEWWIERARTAYFLQHFDEQVDCGRRALAIAAGSAELPNEAALADSPVLRDARAIEALRWIGDGDARLLTARAGKGVRAELGGMIEGLRALGIVAASPFGSDQDWVSFASFAGAIGLWRQEQAIAQAGAARYPASRDLRQALNSALWNCGRPDLTGVVADSLARDAAPSADADWFGGYAWILAAEDARRTERPRTAAKAYDIAREHFEQATLHNQDYRDSSQYYEAVALVGKAMALARAGERGDAAQCLTQALAFHRDLSQLVDGLGYNALDLVDKLVEWRATPSPPVAPMQLLDQIDRVAGEEAFWAVAVSDSALREALRADGRNPIRADKETVDAGGNKITMPMGLPTDEGDTWLRASIEAGRRAAARAKTDADKLPLAQSCTIWAERMFERHRLDGVQPALAEAALQLGLEPPPADADEAALRALAAKLRQQLGEARPRLREGR